jgi:hypothetical protein
VEDSDWQGIRQLSLMDYAFGYAPLYVLRRVVIHLYDSGVKSFNGENVDWIKTILRIRGSTENDTWILLFPVLHYRQHYFPSRHYEPDYIFLLSRQVQQGDHVGLKKTLETEAGKKHLKDLLLIDPFTKEALNSSMTLLDCAVLYTPPDQQAAVLGCLINAGIPDTIQGFKLFLNTLESRTHVNPALAAILGARLSLLEPKDPEWNAKDYIDRTNRDARSSPLSSRQKEQAQLLAAQRHIEQTNRFPPSGPPA